MPFGLISLCNLAFNEYWNISLLFCIRPVAKNSQGKWNLCCHLHHKQKWNVLILLIMMLKVYQVKLSHNFCVDTFLSSIRRGLFKLIIWKKPQIFYINEFVTKTTLWFQFTLENTVIFRQLFAFDYFLFWNCNRNNNELFCWYFRKRLKKNNFILCLN